MSLLKFSPLVQLWGTISLKDPIEMDISEDAKGKDNKSHYHDPILSLLKNLEIIETVLSLKNLTKLLYFNRIRVHEILYENQKFIVINSSQNFDYLFYLTLLIKSQSNIINYIYSLNYINKIFELVGKEKSDKNNLKKLIISKMICDLINNYKRQINIKKKIKNY